MHAIRAMTYTAWTAVSQTVKSVASSTANAVKQAAHPIFSRLSNMQSSPLKQALLGSLGTCTGLATISRSIASGNTFLLCIGTAIALGGEKTIQSVLDGGFQQCRSWLPFIESLKQKANDANSSVESIQREIIQQLSPLQSTFGFNKILKSIQEVEDKEKLIQEIEKAKLFIENYSNRFKLIKFAFILAALNMNLVVLLRGCRNQGNEHFIF